MNGLFVPQPPLRNASKLLLCLIAAVGVSVALFYFMHQLITRPIPDLPDVEFSGFVKLLPMNQPPPPQTDTPEPKEVKSEPKSPLLDVQSLPTQVSALELVEGPELALAGLQLGDGFGQGQESVIVDTALNEAFGADTRQGFVEVRPYATRRPNIPDIAYQNQLNGWVLVIFNVSATGKPHNIKVLDASPKGIFEEEVIKAVKRWRYDVRAMLDSGQDVIMTQRIELDWQNYAQNLPYYDE